MDAGGARSPSGGTRAEVGEGSSLYPRQHHKLLRRADAFPFGLPSWTPAAAAAFPQRTLASASYNGSVVDVGGGAVILRTHTCGIPADFHGGPFVSLAAEDDGAILQRRSPFTAVQRQELHRQASIFRFIMASTPVPPELLFGIRCSDDGRLINSGACISLSRRRRSPSDFDRPLCSSHEISLLSCRDNGGGAVGGGGGDSFNLRLAAGSSGDLEPGRCRRTDGKKWRCSRDVAAGQKYCERHMHRARPRSRKPVEPDSGAGPSAAGTVAIKTRADLTTPGSCPPYATAGPGEHFGDADLRFPTPFITTPREENHRFLGAAGGADVKAAEQVPSPKMPPKTATFDLRPQRRRGDDRLNLNHTDDNRTRLLPSTDISSSLEEVAELPPDRRCTPRRSADTWARESPLQGFALYGGADEDGQKVNGGGSPASWSLGKFSPSNLTLSMSGTLGGEEDGGYLRAIDWGKPPAPSWMCSVVSPFGGPLAEVLQTSAASTTSSTFRDDPAGCGPEEDVHGGGARLIDLMGTTSCDGEGGSPGCISARWFSSPAGVLQATALVAVSDDGSSNNGSSTFGPGPRPKRPPVGR